MSRREELQKHTLFLYEGDYRKLQDYYPEISAALVIRKIVRKHLDSLDAQSDDDTHIEVEGTL